MLRIQKTDENAAISSKTNIHRNYIIELKKLSIKIMLQKTKTCVPKSCLKKVGCLNQEKSAQEARSALNDRMLFPLWRVMKEALRQWRWVGTQNERSWHAAEMTHSRHLLSPIFCIRRLHPTPAQGWENEENWENIT